MKILLGHNSLYFPSLGGGDKSNRLLMEALAAKGHMVRVVARVEAFGEPGHRELVGQLTGRGVTHQEMEDLIRFERNRVDVRTLTRSPHLRAYFAGQIADWDPDVILTSTDDPAQLLFDIAIKSSRARLVYLIRATIAVPFGPDSASTSTERTANLRHADGAVGVSEYVAAYARRWGGLDAVHVPISLMEPGTAEPLGRFRNLYVTMVNPCAVKGIAIFLGLAQGMPDLSFAAVPTWGTTLDELDRLRAMPNVALLAPVDDISTILQQTRVVLVPSLWAEARSRMVMEAMLRAIPVIASDVGGLREAKLGVPYVIPVAPITHYRPAMDSNMVPVADVPGQDLGPWQTVLRRLTGDEPHWTAISSASRDAALAYGESLTADAFEAYLEELLRGPKKYFAAPPVLSEDKKRLLALKLKQRSGAVWFPRCAERKGPRLFCFPHAGAGAVVFRGWNVPGLATCPVLLPGREERAGEQAFVDMPQLIAALHEAIRSQVDARSVFFGHSMGAGIAFEVARMLRRGGGPLPRALIVSGAKPPQYRRDRAPEPEPPDENLIAQIRDLGGVPDELIPLALPLLRADTRLYRNYTYREEPPLAGPLFAYCGDSDPNVSPEQMADWRQQTRGTFALRVFPGGHFYLRENLAAVLDAIAKDLTPAS